MTAADRLRWWLSVFETTQPEELDCDTVFEALDVVAEARVRGEHGDLQVARGRTTRVRVSGQVGRVTEVAHQSAPGG